MTVPAQPKLFHIIHVDRLKSIIAAGGLLCDAQILAKGSTPIGMSSIMQCRLRNLMFKVEKLSPHAT